MIEKPKSQKYKIHPITLILCCLSLFSANCLAKKKILIIETISVPAVLEHTRWFKKHLKERNIWPQKATIEVFKGEGSAKRIEQHLYKKVKNKSVDIVVANATLAAKMAKKVLHKTKIPIVFFTVSDPVGTGLIEKIDQQTNTNITGIVYSVDRAIKLKIASRLLANKKTTFGIIATDYPSVLGDIDLLKEKSKSQVSINFYEKVIPYQGGNSKQIKKMLDQSILQAKRMKKKIDYFWEANGPLSELSEYSQRLQKIKPIIYATTKQSVINGSLFFLSPDNEGTGREAADIVMSILNGKDAGSIPASRPTKANFGINISTAKKLGIIVPSDLLDLAEGDVYQ